VPAGGERDPISTYLRLSLVLVLVTFASACGGKQRRPEEFVLEPGASFEAPSPVAASALGLRVELLELLPLPISTRPTSQGDYRLRLRISRS